MNIKRTFKLLFPRLYTWHCNHGNIYRSKMNNDEIRNEICRLYKHHTGRNLDWLNLRRYSEKMQWKKLYYINPLEKNASDKYAVRKWVAEIIGPEHLIPLVGVWDRFEDIDFDSMPPKFVLKTTHSSSNLLIVKDKSKIDYDLSALMFKIWLSVDYAYTSFEMNYKGIPRKIIGEKYIQDENGELRDYKFLCFDGKPYCCWVDKGRFTEHTRDIYNMNWELLPWTNCFPNSGESTPRPQNFDKMIEIAQKLSSYFSHVRVDLYNVDGFIYFGELTFCESSGFGNIKPDNYDFILGEMWNLPINTQNNKR